VRYLLDTCIIQAVLKGEPGSGNLQVRIETAVRGSLAISALTAVEIWVGLARRRTPRVRRMLFESLLRQMRILAFDEASARQAYVVRRHLEQTGQEIGRMDPLIAAQAMATASVCVTDNLRHFLRIPGLVIENWLRPR
jgi:tRNA(fMet)-specific endonuclease VapC